MNSNEAVVIGGKLDGKTIKIDKDHQLGDSVILEGEEYLFGKRLVPRTNEVSYMYFQLKGGK